MDANQFAQMYNGWNLNQRLDWLNFSSQGNPDPGQRTQVIRTWVAQNYGADAAYLDNPELGPILMQAATEGWTSDRLQAAMMNTNYWRSMSDSQRKFNLLQATDPATALQEQGAIIQQIQDIAQTEGITNITAQQLQDMAPRLISQGRTTTAEIQRAVAAQAQYSPTHPVGKLGGTMDAVQKQAADMMVPLSDQAAFSWAQNIEMGAADTVGMTDYMKQLALGAHPQFATGINAGQTVKQIVDPYIQQTAKLLELSPDQVDLTSQKFAPMIQSKDPQTGEPAAMSLSQAGDFVRGLNDYKTTNDARASAATVTEQIGKVMGSIT